RSIRSTRLGRERSASAGTPRASLRAGSPSRGGIATDGGAGIGIAGITGTGAGTGVERGTIGGRAPSGGTFNVGPRGGTMTIGTPGGRTGSGGGVGAGA